MTFQKFGRIMFIPGHNGARYPYCNSLFIDDDIKVIIDPGSDEMLLKDLNSSNDVKITLMSHYHEDHQSFNNIFKNSQIWVHEYEAPCYRSLSVLMDYYGLNDSDHREEWRDLLVNRYNYIERFPNHEFKHGECLYFGKTRLQIIHTPGHSIGHCSFYFPDEGILFLSDYDLTSFGPWYGDRSSDIDQTISSMEYLLRIPADIYITSHEMGIIKGPIYDLAEQFLNTINQREKSLIEILKKNPMTMEEIVSRWIIYGRERSPKFFFEFGERGMIRKHLERLVNAGSVRKKNDLFVLQQ